MLKCQLFVAVVAALAFASGSSAHLTYLTHGHAAVPVVAGTYAAIPTSRFARTDWTQPGSLVTSPVHAPIVQPVYKNVVVAGPTHYTQHLVANPPLVVNERHLTHGVAHVPAVTHVGHLSHVVGAVAHSPLVATATTHHLAAVRGY